MREGEAEQRERMVRGLMQEGVLRDSRVAAALKAIPRHLFVPVPSQAVAYSDTPLPIGEGQTISAPHMVAMMLEALDLREGQKVLEVGGGSGYHAALAAWLIGPRGRVFTVERIPSLASKARENIARAGMEDRVKVIIGDGSTGLPEEAPFDRIFVTAAAPDVPPPLMDQLGVGGRLLIPVGSRHFQDLVLMERGQSGFPRRNLGGCVFVPLIGEHGFGA